jgi:rhamnosyltransferase
MFDSNLSVWAVVVSYNPVYTILEDLIAVLLPQVSGLILVDNGSANDVSAISRSDKVIFIQLKYNLGIASAQNLGIQRAVKLGASHIYFSDQDSIPNKDTVDLLTGFLSSGSFDRVAAVGPAIIDSRSGIGSAFIGSAGGWPKRIKWDVYSTCPSRPLEVSFLISSGMLVPVSVLTDLGYMRDEYFIDHVDTEWCFRARQKGYRLFALPSAVLNHSIGDRVRVLRFFGTRQIMCHSSLRDYYMFRNTIFLLSDISMSFRWRAFFALRLIRYQIYFLLFEDGRMSRFKAMFLGLYHGVIRRSGKL